MQTAANSLKPHPAPCRWRALVRVGVMALTCLLAIGVLAWLLTAAWLSARAGIDAAGPAAAEELLAFGAASLALAIGAWLVLATLLEVLAHLPGRVGATARVWSARLTPAVARKVATFILGVGVGVAGGPTQALAGPRASAPVTTSSSVTSPAPSGVMTSSAGPEAPTPGFQPASAAPGFLPAAAEPAPPAPGFTPAAPRVRPQADPGLLGGRVAPAPASEVVVHRGDSLWSIAARHLGPHASDAEIARAWPQWFELNRDVIGGDPDVILPGQVLRAPAPDETASVTR